MFKKLLFPSLVFLLAGCSSDSSQSPIPAEFAGADYQISDRDAKRWVAAGNQAEQCIYPNLTRIQQEHFSKEDTYIYSQYIFFYPLEDIIGADNVKMIQDDPVSMDYLTYQRKKFKHITAEPMETEKCEVLRKKARDDLAVIKGEYRNAMAEETKQTDGAKDSGQGGNLEKNKFSFDILKWGIGLML